MIGPTDLLHPSPAPHFKTFRVFLIYCPKHPSFSTIQSHAPNVAFYQFLPQIFTTRTKTANTTQKSNATPNHKTKENNKKWATFTFPSPHIQKFTNLFKHTNIKISFKCSNTLAQLTKPAANHNIPPHNKSGVCRLTRKTCSLSYVGQTSRNLRTRFQEHIRYIKTYNPQSAYTQHILNNQHEYGTLSESMTLLKPLQHENMLLPFKQLHIQSLHQAGKLIPEQYPNDPNPLFQLAFIQPHPASHSAEPVKQHLTNRTHKPQLYTRLTTPKPKVCTSYF